MVSMTLDPSSALAEKYKGNRQILEQAVLGRGGDAGIDPYSALRALQKLNVADKYEQMQQAMRGQVNPPSVAQQTLAQAARAQAPMMAPPSPAPQAPQSGGLAAMPVPEETFGMAGGGIVAFANGGTSYQEQISKLSYEGLTPEERQAEIDKYESDIAARSKPEEYYAKRTKQIEDIREMGPQELEQQKGLAALQAASAMLQGNNVMRGLGAAGAAFGQSYGPALAAANKEKRALAEMQMNIEAAKRQEALGNYRDARAAADAADKRGREATMFELEKNKALMSDQQERAKIAATKEAAMAKTKDPSDRMQMYNVNLQNALARIVQRGKQAGETDEAFKARAQLEAQEQAAERTAEQWRSMGATSADITQFKTLADQLKNLTANTALQLSSHDKWQKEYDAIQAQLNAVIARIPTGQQVGTSALAPGFELDK